MKKLFTGSKIFTKLKLFLQKSSIISKVTFIVLGIASTAWFLLRVVPKPSRATYPCMQAASPFMAAFVVYLISLGTTVFALKKFKRNLIKSNYLAALVFLVTAFISFSVYQLYDSNISLANTFNINDEFPYASNAPIGTAQGLFPGRVVWIHDPAATNENYNPKSGSKVYWSSDANTDQSKVDLMVESAIMQYGGTSDTKSSWNAIFSSFNKTHSSKEQGYQKGEKIAIKINLTNSKLYETRMDATPQLVLTFLKQLIEVVGANQGDITIGDPYRPFRKEYKDKCISVYPDVVYVDGTGSSGVEKTVPSNDEVLIFSNNSFKSRLPQHYLDAKYFINMACLKTHNEGGITLCAKNHQGSYLKTGADPSNQSAFDMHPYLPANSSGSGKYRHTVDYMGHKETGGKTLLYIVDGIWAGESWEGFIKKFKMAPFDDDYPSSVIISQDPVAIESVGFDILFNEYSVDASKNNYPISLKVEIADYLKQCASSEFWPAGLKYDPEGDGTSIGSLGVLEHWNNATDRLYSRNLKTGSGVELVYLKMNTNVSVQNIANTMNCMVYPNPISESAMFRFSNPNHDKITLKIIDLSGRILNEKTTKTSELKWNKDNHYGNKLNPGIYLYSIEKSGINEKFTGKITVVNN